MSYEMLDEIYDDLRYLNSLLAEHDKLLMLKVVGGAAVIFNEIEGYSTDDIDTLHRIEAEINEIIEDSGIPINDDVLDYIDKFGDVEFIADSEAFSNIVVYYLDLPDVIRTRLTYDDPHKIENLARLLKYELSVELDARSIAEYFDDCGVIVDTDDVESFLMNVAELEIPELEIRWEDEDDA